MLLVLVACRVAEARPVDPLTAVGVDEHVGTRLPLERRFRAVGAGEVTLAQFVDGTRPVVLVLAYARCTMLCNLVLRGVAAVAHRMAPVPGADYRLVVISLDPAETIDEASRRQATLLAQLGRGGDRASWPYLVGTRANIDAVAQALGFRYAWDERTEQYAHPAVIFVLTPDGRVARYLHGVQFDPAEVTGALAAAARGQMLSPAAVEVLRCFRFDPASRRIGKRAELVLQLGAATVCAMLLGCITGLVIWERRRARKEGRS